jgi:hypothetical protein
LIFRPAAGKSQVSFHHPGRGLSDPISGSLAVRLPRSSVFQRFSFQFPDPLSAGVNPKQRCWQPLCRRFESAAFCL